MGALVITQTGTLFAGTGEANPGGGSMTYGGSGIYRSIDGGTTWQVVGLTDSGAIGRLAVDPTNPQHLFAAAAGRLYNSWRRARRLRIERWRNRTWTSSAGRRQRYHRRGRSDHRSYQSQSASSPQCGTIFANPICGPMAVLGQALPFDRWRHELARLTAASPPRSPTIGRIGVALAPSNPQRLYAIIIQTGGLFQGFYRSDNGGDSWTKLAYGLAISRARNRPMDGGSDGCGLIRSMTLMCSEPASICASRKTADSHSPRNLAPHPDDHAMVWDLKVPNRVYLG